mmetsp:Transcript_128590/g.222139  ORF Transcript_128590/g.222139 Transcript_128590/m.222139 type:complete len:146 (+) Transcript_128590:164-601(+)
MVPRYPGGMVLGRQTIASGFQKARVPAAKVLHAPEWPCPGQAAGGKNQSGLLGGLQKVGKTQLQALVHKEPGAGAQADVVQNPAGGLPTEQQGARAFLGVWGYVFGDKNVDHGRCPSDPKDREPPHRPGGVTEQITAELEVHARI